MPIACGFPVSGTVARKEETDTTLGTECHSRYRNALWRTKKNKQREGRAPFRCRVFEHERSISNQPDRRNLISHAPSPGEPESIQSICC